MNSAHRCQRRLDVGQVPQVPQRVPPPLHAQRDAQPRLVRRRCAGDTRPSLCFVVVLSQSHNEEGVSLAQNMQVGPGIPVGAQP